MFVLFRKKFLFSSLLLFLVFVTNSVSVFAADDDLFSFMAVEGQPNMLDASPGSNVDLSFLLTNWNETVDRNYVFDAMTNIRITKEGKMNMPAPWISLPERVFVKAGESSVVGINIDVPTDTKEGTYIVGFRAKVELEDESQVGGASGVKLGTAVSSMFSLNVLSNGEVVKGSIVPESVDVPATQSFNYFYLLYAVIAIALFILIGKLLGVNKRK